MSWPAASVIALADRMVPAGDSIVQPVSTATDSLCSHKELFVSTAATTALPDRSVAALTDRKLPVEIILQPFPGKPGLCSQRRRSAVMAKATAWPAPSVTLVTDRIVPAGESKVGVPPACSQSEPSVFTKKTGSDSNEGSGLLRCKITPLSAVVKTSPEPLPQTP